MNSALSKTNVRNEKYEYESHLEPFAEYTRIITTRKFTTLTPYICGKETALLTKIVL